MKYITFFVFFLSTFSCCNAQQTSKKEQYLIDFINKINEETILGGWAYMSDEAKEAFYFCFPDTDTIPTIFDSEIGYNYEITHNDSDSICFDIRQGNEIIKDLCVKSWQETDSLYITIPYKQIPKFFASEKILYRRIMHNLYEQAEVYNYMSDFQNEYLKILNLYSHFINANFFMNDSQVLLWCGKYYSNFGRNKEEKKKFIDFFKRAYTPRDEYLLDEFDMACDKTDTDKVWIDFLKEKHKENEQDVLIIYKFFEYYENLYFNNGRKSKYIKKAISYLEKCAKNKEYACVERLERAYRRYQSVDKSYLGKADKLKTILENWYSPR